MKTEPIIHPPKSSLLKSGRVILSPGESVGWHVTRNREEIIIILRGMATILEEKQQTRIGSGETHYIRNGVSHNVRNDSESDLEYIYTVGIEPQSLG
jgi:mannose-6-phosphate isomerase-like protein (cupin superfamily)